MSEARTKHQDAARAFLEAEGIEQAEAMIRVAVSTPGMWRDFVRDGKKIKMRWRARQGYEIKIR